MFDSLIKQLSEIQTQVLGLCQQSGDCYHIQAHADLSPIGWHMGHCVYTENYWIRERLLQQESADNEMNSLYIPEQSIKNDRGYQLPEIDELCHWVKTNQSQNISLLEKNRSNTDQLMKNNFLLHFLIQHYSQHYETIYMILSQLALNSDHDPRDDFTIKSSSLNREYNILKHDDYIIGGHQDHMPYDNEYPRYQHELDTIKIAKTPVTNSEYLRFLEEDGYTENRYWSESGWQWRTTNNIIAPEYWRMNNNGNWYSINIHGAVKLKEQDPVYGISYYEASAFASWAEARLPHESEWEAARSGNLLEQTGRVWEWCHNTFYPYEGFTAYPYAGYSTPYFDNNHFTLKGGSCYTKPTIKRPSFRNYYQADKRFLYAGMRLVYE